MVGNAVQAVLTTNTFVAGTSDHTTSKLSSRQRPIGRRKAYLFTSARRGGSWDPLAVLNLFVGLWSSKWRRPVCFLAQGLK